MKHNLKSSKILHMISTRILDISAVGHDLLIATSTFTKALHASVVALVSFTETIDISILFITPQMMWIYIVFSLVASSEQICKINVIMAFPTDGIDNKIVIQHSFMCRQIFSFGAKPISGIWSVIKS